MAWEEELFGVLDDLEGQAEALFDAERQVELADRSRAEYTFVTLGSRLMASLDATVTLSVHGLGRVSGVLTRVGDGWCLLAHGEVEQVVPWTAILAVDGTSERSVPEVAWPAVARLRLGSALRRIGDAGGECRVQDVSGTSYDGRLGRVGADFVEVIGPAQVTLVPFAALAAVQRRG